MIFFVDCVVTNFAGEHFGTLRRRYQFFYLDGIFFFV